MVRNGHLVHLVKNNDWVRRTATLDGLDNSARHCANVCSAVSANLALVVQTTQRNTAKLSAQRSCYALTERGLTNSRRAIEAENWRFQIALELDYGKVLENTVLNLLKTKVVGIELLACAVEVKVVLGNLVPRKVEHQVEVGHLYRVLGNCRVEALELCNLLVKNLCNLLFPHLLLCCLAELLNIAVYIVTQLLLNGLHLLLEVVVALLLVNLGLNLLLNLLLELEKLLLADKNLKELA